MIDLLAPEDLMTQPVTEAHEVIIEYSHEDQKSLTMQGALDRMELAQTM